MKKTVKTLKTVDGETLFYATNEHELMIVLGGLALSERLKGLDLSNVDVEKLHFNGYDMSEGKYAGVSFKECHFIESNLSDCSFENCTFSYANFTDANLTGVKFINCSFQYCIGNGKQIKNIYGIADYFVAYTKDDLAIGCRQFPIETWRKFVTKDLLSIGGKQYAKDWAKYKHQLFSFLGKNKAL